MAPAHRKISDLTKSNEIGCNNPSAETNREKCRTTRIQLLIFKKGQGNGILVGVPWSDLGAVTYKKVD